jgi:hypothetical protein
MGKLYDILTPDLQAWLARQKIFFVATAPLTGDGHVNCSPKGGDTFRVISERRVAYLDLTGSGIETISHLQENGRIVVMFCAFEGPPKIVRLHGRGDVIYPRNPEYLDLLHRFPANIGARAVIRITVDRIADSCGYAVPFFDFVSCRDTLDRSAESRGAEALAAYRAERNKSGLDGLTGYYPA